jgi:hypothetical protein
MRRLTIVLLFLTSSAHAAEFHGRCSELPFLYQIAATGDADHRWAAQVLIEELEDTCRTQVKPVPAAPGR